MHGTGVQFVVFVGGAQIMPGRTQYLTLFSVFIFYFQNLLFFVVEIKAVLRCFS